MEVQDTQAARRGRPKGLDGAALRRLAEIVRSLSGRVALSSTVMMWVLQKESVNIAVGAVQGVRHRIIFGGKTNRIHPVGPSQLHQQVTHTESHWSSTATLLQMVGLVDSHVNPNNEQCAWILLLDCGLCHISSEEHCSEMAEEWPWVQICFVPAGYTATCQPLDASYIRTLKCALRNHCGQHFARTIISNADNAEEALDMSLARAVLWSSLLGFVSAAYGPMDRDGLRASGWKHLLVTDENHAAVLEEANEAQAYDTSARRVERPSGNTIPRLVLWILIRFHPRRI